VTLIGSNVPRWVLRHGSKGYLTDDCSDALQFCAHAKDARHFFAKRNAEKLANTYGLEVLEYPNYIATKRALRRRVHERQKKLGASRAVFAD